MLQWKTFWIIIIRNTCFDLYFWASYPVRGQSECQEEISATGSYFPASPTRVSALLPEYWFPCEISFPRQIDILMTVSPSTARWMWAGTFQTSCWTKLGIQASQPLFELHLPSQHVIAVVSLVRHMISQGSNILRSSFVSWRLRHTFLQLFPAASCPCPLHVHPSFWTCHLPLGSGSNVNATSDDSNINTTSGDMSASWRFSPDTTWMFLLPALTPVAETFDS